MSDSLWYKNAVIYQLHVRTFCDANGDGVGDLPYQAVQLFERLTDRYPALRLYGDSPVVRALEFSAQLFPIFAPQPKLVDGAPRVAPQTPQLSSAPREP